MSLKNEANRSLINNETFELFLDAFVNKTEKILVLHQPIAKSDMASLMITEKEQKFTFRNKISDRRIVDLKNKHRLVTFPHGY